MMLLKGLAVIAAAVVACAVSLPEPAVADGVRTRSIAKSVRYGPRYYGVRYVRGLWPGGPDPYVYAYKRTGYYPYFNSDYWVPRKQMIARTRYPMRIPEYYSSWGYPIACKITLRRHCGVPFVPPDGHPAQYYRRDVQLTHHHH